VRILSELVDRLALFSVFVASVSHDRPMLEREARRPTSSPRITFPCLTVTYTTAQAEFQEE
jgi:hypothetical protein